MDSPNFAREWAKAQDSVLAFIGSLVADFGAAEELLQETAAQAFTQSERYDPARPFLPWAIGIARYVVLEHRRKAAKDRHVFDQEVVAGLADAFEKHSEQSEPFYRALTVCRGQLSPRSMYMLRLRYERNLPPKEIAAQTGAAPGTVRTLLHRIRQQLRTCIEQRLRAEGLLS